MRHHRFVHIGGSRVVFNCYNKPRRSSRAEVNCHTSAFTLVAYGIVPFSAVNLVDSINSSLSCSISNIGNSSDIRFQITHGVTHSRTVRKNRVILAVAVDRIGAVKALEQVRIAIAVYNIVAVGTLDVLDVRQGIITYPIISLGYELVYRLRGGMLNPGCARVQIDCRSHSSEVDRNIPIAVAAVKRVVAGAACKLIVAGTSVKRVVAHVSFKHVVAVAAIERVVAGASGDIVITAHTFDGIVAALTHNTLARIATLDHAVAVTVHIALVLSQFPYHVVLVNWIRYALATREYRTISTFNRIWWWRACTVNRAATVIAFRHSIRDSLRVSA